MKTGPFDKPNLIATAVALAVLIVSGTGYRITAEHLSRPRESVPLAPGALGRLPLKLGDWIGRDVPLDPAVIKATDTDELLNRVYTRRAGTDAVGLYIAYGARARDLMPHRPEVCYPSSGWTQISRELTDVALTDGSRLVCRMYRYSRGGLASKSVTVLNYYLVDGRYSPDVSLLRSKAMLGSSGVRYMAQVQITCRVNAIRGPEATERIVKAFASEWVSAIRALLPDAPDQPATQPGDIP